MVSRLSDPESSCGAAADPHRHHRPWRHRATYPLGVAFNPKAPARGSRHAPRVRWPATCPPKRRRAGPGRAPRPPRAPYSSRPRGRCLRRSTRARARPPRPPPGRSRRPGAGIRWKSASDGPGCPRDAGRPRRRRRKRLPPSNSPVPPLSGSTGWDRRPPSLERR